MNAVTFDTHFYIKKLQQKGFTEPQAESVVDMVKETQEGQLDDLATRQELLTFKSELKGDIGALRNEIRADTAEMKSELVRWMFGGFIAMGGMLAAILFKLH
jgi:hypothetical protein